MRLRVASLLAVGLIAGSTLPLWLKAQTTTSGGLSGVVTDPSNAAVPGAIVVITDATKGTVYAIKTNRDGAYSFSFLAPGKYTLRVSHEGFRERSYEVDVLLGPPGTRNIALEIAGAASMILVTDEMPLLQTENGDLSLTMNSQQIAEVPNPGNDLTYIAQTAPGVVMNTDFGGNGNGNFSVLGMPGTSNLFTMDGMDLNDNGSGTNLTGPSNMLLGQNQIQEAAVISIGYPGRFGGAAGANINFITKSGSNHFHGNAEYFWNGSVLNANNWLSNAYSQPRPFDIANQWAGSFGGPIIKEKLFFFFDNEGLRIALPSANVVQIPSLDFEAATIANLENDKRFGGGSKTDLFYKQMFALYNSAPGASDSRIGVPGGGNGCPSDFTLPDGGPCTRYFLFSPSQGVNETLTSGRIDWNASDSDRAFLRIQHDGGRNHFYADPISPVFNASFSQPWWQGQIIETHTFNSSTASQFLFAGSYFSGFTQLDHAAQALAAFPTTLNFGVINTFASLGALNSSLSAPEGRSNTQYQLSQDFLWNHGKHTLGWGAAFEGIYWTGAFYQNNELGTLIPQTLTAFYDGGVDPASPNTDFTRLTQAFTDQTSERIKFYSVGLYAQDQWNARPNLTLTFAMRADHSSNPICQRSCFARTHGPFESINHDPNQPYNVAIRTNQKQEFERTDEIVWAPRISFAWQPLGNGRNTLIRGGIGLFHDPIPGNLVMSLSGNPPLLNTYSVLGDNLTPGEHTNLFQDALASNTAFVTGFNAGETLPQFQKEDPNFSPPGLTLPGPQAHSPQYQRWSLQLQQAFGSGTSVSIGYVGHHGIHELVQNPNANAFGFGSLPPAICASPPVPPCADARFGAVTEYLWTAISNYNGLVASFQHRQSHWGKGLFQANYTYSHAFDEFSNGGLTDFTSVGLVYPQGTDLRAAYGPAEYDVRHSFNANYVWELPLQTALRGHGPDLLTKGWQVSGTVFARTGLPYTVIDINNTLAANNSFGGVYAVPVGSLGPASACGKGAAGPEPLHPCQPPEILADGSLNLSANFVQPNCETGFNTGNLPTSSGPCNGFQVTFAQGRNRFRGPSYFSTDLTVMKNTQLPRWENAEFGIGFQFFNLFNHPNFGFPDTVISDSTFGQIQGLEQSPTSLLGAVGAGVSSRMIQVKAQVRF
jgi:hypothetical protein